jgi:hypothetical protein
MAKTIKNVPDYEIAIPSYKRHNLLLQQTIPTLAKLKADLDKITVFVASTEEQFIYQTTLEGANLDIPVVVGVPGIGPQRQFINQYYSEGTRIFSMDDDVCGVYQKKDDKYEETTLTLDQIVEIGYGLCEKHGARIWGINAVLNGLFMKDTATVGLRYVCGIFHGGYAQDPCLTDPERSLISSGEDFENSLRSFVMYGNIVRLDWLAPKTKYFNNGGIQESVGGKEARRLDHAKALGEICSRYPELAKTYVKAGDVTNIRLKVVTNGKEDRAALV